MISPAYELGQCAALRKEAVMPPVILETLGVEQGRRDQGVQSTTNLPVDVSDIALSQAPLVGSAYLMGRLGFPSIQPGLGGAVKATFGPLGLPMYGLSELVGLGAAPFSDPAYQVGRKGYFGALGEQLGRNVEAVGEAGRSAREKYGPLGLPVQALHGILNPVSSSLYLLKNLKETFTGREGETRAKEAQFVVARTLGG
jgi:hypothetical protein